MEKLLKIQSELKAPKNQFNKFGGYNYRSQEDILEAVKPLLKKYGCTLTITDTIEECAGRVYVQAWVTFSDGDQDINVSAYAREAETKKGMDEAQITGSASSYARKYALNGLFLIDDTRDADATNEHKTEKPKKPEEKPQLIQGSEQFKKAVEFLSKGGDWEKVEKNYKVEPVVKNAIYEQANV